MRNLLLRRGPVPGVVGDVRPHSLLVAAVDQFLQLRQSARQTAKHLKLVLRIDADVRIRMPKQEAVVSAEASPAVGGMSIRRAGSGLCVRRKTACRIRRRTLARSSARSRRRPPCKRDRSCRSRPAAAPAPPAFRRATPYGSHTRPGQANSLHGRRECCRRASRFAPGRDRAYRRRACRCLRLAT